MAGIGGVEPRVPSCRIRGVHVARKQRAIDEELYPRYCIVIIGDGGKGYRPRESLVVHERLRKRDARRDVIRRNGQEVAQERIGRLPFAEGIGGGEVIRVGG